MIKSTPLATEHGFGKIENYTMLIFVKLAS